MWKKWSESKDNADSAPSRNSNRGHNWKRLSGCNQISNICHLASFHLLVFLLLPFHNFSTFPKFLQSYTCPKEKVKVNYHSFCCLHVQKKRTEWKKKKEAMLYLNQSLKPWIAFLKLFQQSFIKIAMVWILEDGNCIEGWGRGRLFVESISFFWLAFTPKFMVQVVLIIWSTLVYLKWATCILSAETMFKINL